MAKKIYGYARVSTREQNLDRQLIALRAHVPDERDIITDKESGKDFERSGYQMLRTALLRTGDTLIVKSLDRLGRNKEQVKAELEYFKSSGIRVKILDLPTTMLELPAEQAWVFDMVNNILLEVMASIAQEERETIRRRQREGIDAAKAQGRHLGRKPAEYPSDWAEVCALWKGGSITAVQAMDRLGLTKSTFYRLVKKWERDG